MHHEAVVDEEHVTTPPREGDALLIHGAARLYDRLTIDWGAVTTDHRPLRDISAVCPALVQKPLAPTVLRTPACRKLLDAVLSRLQEKAKLVISWNLFALGCFNS